jgi:hypothetical protein
VGQNPSVQDPGSQDPPRPPAQSPRESPISVRDVQLGAIYSSQNIPPGIHTFTDPFPLGSSSSFSVSGLIQFTKSGRQSSAHVSYLPEYRMLFQNGTAAASNQSLSGLFNRHTRTSKWQFTASGEGELMSFDEALLSPSKYTRLVSSGAGLDGLSGAVLQGNTTDPALLNTTGFAPDTTLQRFLYGNRTAFAGGQIGVRSLLTPRLTVSVNAGLSQVNHVHNGQDITGFVYPSATTLSLSTDVSYSMSRHSSLGGTVTYGQTQSTFLQNTGSMATVFYKERLRRYWFYEVSGGAGRNSAASAGPGTYLYSAGAGFESSRHSAMLFFSRSLTDGFVATLGPTSAAFTTVSAAWQWHPKRAAWSLVSDFSYFKDAPPHQPAPHTWALNETVRRRIARAYAVQVEVAVGRMGSRRYIQDGRLYQLRQDAVRASFVWFPSRLSNGR